MNPLHAGQAGSAAVTERPLHVHAGPGRAIRELTSLGLTEEASLGILRVLLRCGGHPAVFDAPEL